MTRMLAPLLVAAAALFCAQPASAQRKDPAAADALFRQGRDAMKRGDYATACPKFAESNRLDPAAGTVLNLAQCEDKRGMFASATAHYQEAIDLLPPGDPRIQVAKDGLAAASKRAPRLTVRLPADAPPGTTVLRDGVELGAASLGTALPIDPGEHVIVTRCPGHQEARRSLTIAAGAKIEAVVEVGPPDQDDSGATTRPMPAERRDNVTADERSDAWMTPTGYALGALGLVGVGVGTWFAFDSKNKDGEAAKACGPSGSQQSCDEKNAAAHRSYWASAGSFIGGGIALAGGVVLVLTAPADKSGAATSAWALRTHGGPGNVGIDVGGVW